MATPINSRKAEVARPGWAPSRLTAEEILGVMHSANLEPVVPYPGHKMAWSCVCMRCGATSSPRFHDIRQGNGGCTPCGHVARAAKQRHEGDHADSVMRAAGLTPLEPYVNSTTRWRCRCERCLRIVEPTYGNVHAGQLGCVHCGRSVPDPTAPGIIYLVAHKEWFAFKIGVTSSLARTDRFAAHLRYGWECVQQWQTPNMGTATLVESRILRWWRKELGAPAAVPTSLMPQAGASETVSMLWVDEAAVGARVNAALNEQR